jgi:hypothetical protein
MVIVQCETMNEVIFKMTIYNIAIYFYFKQQNPICCVMVSVLGLSAVDRGCEPRSGQTKDYNIGMCCFSANHAYLRKERKHWLARNQDNVSEWCDMSTCGLLFQ